MMLHCLQSSSIISLYYFLLPSPKCFALQLLCRGQTLVQALQC